jgi:hypothetical protein
MMPIAQLESHHLGDWDKVPPGRGFTGRGRQILHCTFGSVLTHPDLRTELRQTLESHRDLYKDLLADHFVRHLQSLLAGM